MLFEEPRIGALHEIKLAPVRRVVVPETFVASEIGES